MEPNLLLDGLNVQEAADLLEVEPHRIRFPVQQNHLRCGIFVTEGWKGVCFPDHPGVNWVNPVVIDVDRSGKWIEPMRTFRYTGTPTGREGPIITHEVQERFAGHFWYLDGADADYVFCKPDGHEVTWLEPFDGAEDHERDPLGYPEPPFLFRIDKTSPNRLIRTSDLIFLRQDVEKYRDDYLGESINSPALSVKDEKPIKTKERADLYRTIGALCLLLSEKSVKKFINQRTRRHEPEGNG